MSYIPDQVITEVEELKDLGKFDEAMRIINSFLVRDPRNEEALLQVADIKYRSGEIGKASKAIDFLNDQKDGSDPFVLYIKGVLEMEKNHRLDAKKYLQQALEMTKAENHEIVRCYGLCEYWYGNREKGIKFLEDSFHINDRDAEVVYNLIQLYMLEQKYPRAKKMITYFYRNHEKLETVDKKIDYYDEKVGLFDRFVNTQVKINDKKII